MAEIRIQGPDGSSFSFPEGTTADVITAAMQSHYKTPSPDAPPAPKGPYGAADSFAAGALDTATFGTLDELGAGASYLINQLPGGDGASYSDILAKTRGTLKTASEEHPYAYTGGQIAGGVGQGVGLVRGGLSLGARAATAGQGLGRVALGGAVDGAAIGALNGAGSGDGLEGRAQGAMAGGALGLGVGAVAPVATAAISTVARPLVAPVMARLRPDAYANRAVGEGLERSGSSIEQVRDALLAAQRDGQGVFNVADALGNSGQRMLSTVARTPNNARQGVIEALQARQMGQGERLTNALAEGFQAPDTAAQRTAALIAQRSSDATANYGAARAGAQAIDPSAAIQSADDFLRPGAMGVMRNETGIADDSIEAAVRRARGYLTDGTSVLTDFNAGLRSKQELDAMIEGAMPAVQRQLIPIRNALDTALSDASPDYANARNVFRQQSQTIDAVEQGTAAASGRVRAGDSIPAFNNMRPEQQAAFRAGYADPMIARVEASSVSPTTNKARLLMTGKTEQEFPAFAAPGRAEQMGDRIGREQRMFETSNAALGGSKTADNLADAAEMSRFDPAVMTALFQGRPVQAVVTAVTRALSEANGTPPRVVERIARVLMETRPDVARQMLEQATTRTQSNRAIRAVTNAMLTATGASAAGR